MVCKPFSAVATEQLIGLFTAVFSAAEGAEEGQRIGTLVQNMITTTAADDLLGFVAESRSDTGTELVGAILFSRLWFPDGRTGFILSPVAVATPVQRTGVGQRLIRHGLDRLKALGVDRVFTYGDPDYYAQFGFQVIDEAIAQAPQPLRYPHGWLAQSLQSREIIPMQGVIRCVDALNDPGYW